MTWALESLKKVSTLMGSFSAKYILFQLKKYRAVIFHETERGYKIWRGINLLFQNWRKEFDKFWPERSKVLKNFHFTGLLMSKVYIVWTKNVQRNNLWWNWWRIQNLERNRIVISKLAWEIWQILTRTLKNSQKFSF